MTAENMEDLVSLCKRRGFIFPSNDIYGGMKGLYDFGPMGVELKLNLKSVGINKEEIKIKILCYPRILGYVFNPLSIFFVIFSFN